MTPHSLKQYLTNNQVTESELLSLYIKLYNDGKTEGYEMGAKCVRGILAKQRALKAKARKKRFDTILDQLSTISDARRG